MSEKRILILDADVIRKVDENRGDMSFSEFINFLIEIQLKRDNVGQSSNHVNDHVTKEEFQQFEQGIRELLRNFLEFFLSYGLELGSQTKEKEIDKLGQKLQALGFNIKTDKL